MDLLSILAAEDEPQVVHLIHPNMALACGRDLLAMFDARAVDGFRRTALSIEAATCPDCLAPGREALRALRAAMQGKQAPIEN